MYCFLTDVSPAPQAVSDTRYSHRSILKSIWPNLLFQFYFPPILPYRIPAQPVSLISWPGQHTSAPQSALPSNLRKTTNTQKHLPESGLGTPLPEPFLPSSLSSSESMCKFEFFLNLGSNFLEERNEVHHLGNLLKNFLH